MDVHDVGDYKIGGEWRVFEPGMVMTVEPGLYVAAGDKKVARKWWNIGIRIEDDVLVTRDGHKVLTAAAPKSVDDIEAIVGQG
jgi:Xaa-Pro aminopeptidase